MKALRTVWLTFVLVLFPAISLAQAADSLAPDVRVQPLAENVWLHITYSDSTSDYPNYPANGLIVRMGEQLVIVDTGWNGRQLGLLVEWAERTLGLPVRVAVITHSHGDRTGGLNEAFARGLRVLLSDSTAARLTDEQRDGDLETFHDTRVLQLGGQTMELFAPGPAHAPDNIVVWLPQAHLLFGGCMVKSMDAETLGNVADANLTRWPASMRRVMARYGGATWVVPGHGDTGGRELLTHTLELVKKQKR